MKTAICSSVKRLAGRKLQRFNMTSNRVIRCNSKKPTPFLVRQESKLKRIIELHLPDKPIAADIGCGGGRNSDYLKRLGFNTRSFDLQADYGEPLDFEKDNIPMYPRSASVILLQYIMMFLSEEARRRIFLQCLSIAAKPSLIVVEVQDVKHGNIHGQELEALLREFQITGDDFGFHSRRTAGKLLLWRGISF